MKGKYLPIIALSLAIVLVGTVAYASDKRKKDKLLDFELSEMSEEALKAELLNSSEDQHKKQPVTKVSSSIKSVEVDLAEFKVK